MSHTESGRVLQRFFKITELCLKKKEFFCEYLELAWVSVLTGMGSCWYKMRLILNRKSKGNVISYEWINDIHSYDVFMLG
ncbi:hypothetical protein CI610_01738 [invertebrate metagenome]|uniref:Uncharacterized protein n=1 Tax=invertebrate metagenome TaxID=1711999 RepID=A0A2H9T7U5_9ZZZZ